MIAARLILAAGLLGLVPPAAHASYNLACILKGAVSRIIIDTSAEGTPIPPSRFLMRISTAQARFSGNQTEHRLCQQFVDQTMQIRLRPSEPMPTEGDRLSVGMTDYFDQNRRRQRVFRVIPEDG